MTKNKLRVCKILPGVTVTALFGYTCAVLTDQAVVSAQLNSVIVCWLGLLNVTALLLLGWALLTSDVDDLRVMVARSRANPRLRFMPLHVVPDPEPTVPTWTQPTAPHGALYGSAYGSARPAAVEQRVEQDIFDELERGMKRPGPEDTRDIA